MKIFISADIEGVTTSTQRDDVIEKQSYAVMHQAQMTQEVLACIEGAQAAGATEIVVKDAHGLYACNIDPTKMPVGTKLIRGWSGNPHVMVDGIDDSFDAAMFVGYHSAASIIGNPLAHTVSGKCSLIKMNGMIASEFLIYSYACAYYNVPTVFLSGDKMLCDDSKKLHPSLITCAVKEGVGGMTINYAIDETLKNIKDLSAQALSQDLTHALVPLPKHFELELHYRSHIDWEKASWFPSVKKQSDNIILFQSSNYFEVLTALKWLLIGF